MFDRNFYRMPNKSPEPTAVAAAVASHVASRRWLSFFRSASFDLPQFMQGFLGFVHSRFVRHLLEVFSQSIHCERCFME